MVFLVPHFFFVFFGVILCFKMALKQSAKELSGIHKGKKAMMITYEENICVRSASFRHEIIELLVISPVLMNQQYVH